MLCETIGRVLEILTLRAVFGSLNLDMNFDMCVKVFLTRNMQRVLKLPKLINRICGDLDSKIVSYV